MLKKLEKFGAEIAPSSQKHKEDCVQKIENKTGKLPHAYRKLLLHFGNSIVFNVSLIFKSDEASPWANKGYNSLESIYGVEESRNDITIFEAIDTYKDQFKNQWIPIGSSSGGNQICLCLKGKMDGQVWFWDHESDPIFNEKVVIQGMTKISENFIDFINKLEVDDEDPGISGVVNVELDF